MKMQLTQPKKKLIIKFILLCLVIVGYFTYLNIEYDIMTSGIASLLTWSFFVLCTPIADAGFLLDFPLRLLFGIRMLVSEIMVWFIAIGTNIYFLLYSPKYYDTTALTKVFYAILTTPYPYWAVIILSCIGTFLSVIFGDEMIDIFYGTEKKIFNQHSHKQQLITIVVICLVVIIAYYELIHSLGIESIVSGKK